MCILNAGIIYEVSISLLPWSNSRCRIPKHCCRTWVLAPESAFNVNNSGSVGGRVGLSRLSISRANWALHTSVCWSCARTADSASWAAKCSLACRFDDVSAKVWLSDIARRPSTHSCLARASTARSLRMSPEAQLIVKVLESSSLGHIAAPAKCTWPRGSWSCSGPDSAMENAVCLDLDNDFRLEVNYSLLSVT